MIPYKYVELINSVKWTFAKTMPKTPHWYSLRKDYSNDEMFIEFVNYIRENGVKEKYFNSQYVYLYLNGFKYWTMGAPIFNKDGSWCTILINRAEVIYNTGYDVIATKYDNSFSDKESLKENQEVIDMIDVKGSVLDIGCGTGLFLDYVKPEKYLGIDISKGMLDIFKEKHPKANIIKTSFEHFSGEQFDTVICLFGGLNYVDSKYYYKIEELTKTGGNIFIMFFKPGYTPETYKKMNIKMDHFETSLTGYKLFPYHNYLIYKQIKK